MRGHEQLIAMRMKGVVPRYGVHIATDERESDWPAAWQQLCHQWECAPETAELHIGEGENVKTLDLRPLVGLEVTVRGMNRKRVVDVFDAARLAGACRVLGHVLVVAAGEPKVNEILDSEGLMTWHK